MSIKTINVVIEKIFIFKQREHKKLSCAKNVVYIIVALAHFTK